MSWCAARSRGQLLCVLLPALLAACAAAPAPAARASLVSAIRRGDAPAVLAQLSAAASSPGGVAALQLNSLVDEKTPVLESLRATFTRVESYSAGGAGLAAALAAQQAILSALLAHGARGGFACPVVDAVIYRDVGAAEALLAASSAAELRECLTSANYGPQRLLHLTAQSHASGFARVVFAACASSYGPGRDGAVSADARALLQHLRLRASGDGAAGDATLRRLCGFDDKALEQRQQSQQQQQQQQPHVELAVWKADVDDLCGTAELDAVAAAAAAAGVSLADALEARNEAGLTPLLLACQSGRGAVARRLVALGADAAATSATGNLSCAHLAAVGGFAPPLASGDDARDEHGRSPADVALRSLPRGRGGASVAADGAAAAAAADADAALRAVFAAFDPAAHKAAG